MKQIILGAIIGFGMVAWVDFINAKSCDMTGHTSLNFTKYECKKVVEKDKQ